MRKAWPGEQNSAALRTPGYTPESGQLLLKRTAIVPAA